MIDQQLYGVKRFLDVIGTKRQVLIEAQWLLSVQVNVEEFTGI